MRDFRFYEAVRLVTETTLSASPLCIWYLLSHVALGLLITFVGCKSSRWK
jgi:hypothetical protein